MAAVALLLLPEHPILVRLLQCNACHTKRRSAGVGPMAVTTAAWSTVGVQNQQAAGEVPLMLHAQRRPSGQQRMQRQHTWPE
mmetsp:Transcript_122393/g.341135  ORF Transcript_122393/g.341135 Transcript_122393/m.341135 type:complete len:82 (-) Transcript_122393:1257-1502(-)